MSSGSLLYGLMPGGKGWCTRLNLEFEVVLGAVVVSVPGSEYCARLALWPGSPVSAEREE